MEKIFFVPQTMTLYELLSSVTRYDKNVFDINTNLNDTQKSKIIEAILLNVPLGVVFLCQSDGKYKFITKYDIIKTIFDFLENKFELCDLELLIEFNGKNIKTIDSFYLRRIQDYEINVFIYLENKHIEKFKQKIEKIIDVFQ